VLTMHDDEVKGARISNYARLALMIMITIMLTIGNVIIASSISILAFTQMVLVLGWNRYLSLFIGLLVAIGVNLFCVFQHKIRAHLKQEQERL
jgi:uncharacterized membrane protein YgaE (UPF0421/DUF939 family)